MKSKTGYRCKLKVIIYESEAYDNFGDFAKKCGINQNTFSAIINDKQLPSFESAYKICEELDMKMKEIWDKK